MMKLRKPVMYMHIGNSGSGKRIIMNTLKISRRRTLRHAYCHAGRLPPDILDELQPTIAHALSAHAMPHPDGAICSALTCPLARQRRLLMPEQELRR